ncbi:response regulator [Pelagibius sp.]|uniref:response regulator n=1 Tax=Pelagibius sp. TaxID=1931238 RepID=UPI003BAF5E1E
MPVRPIILAEDNDKLRRLYSEMLEAAGFKVMHASDGEKAISLLHKIVNPQLIILDVMMPRLDGIQTCARIRKMQGMNPCPILFLTALDSPETILECLNAGGDDYLVKSAPMAEVVERVQYWSRKGSSDDGAERRKKAIRELESLSDDDPNRGGETSDGISGENAIIDLIATFINETNEAFTEKEETFYRFGYLVGLVGAYMKQMGRQERRFHRMVRNLVYRTDFIDRKEIDALLENYERIVNQNQFQEGWQHGQNVAADIGVPQKTRKANSATAGASPS